MEGSMFTLEKTADYVSKGKHDKIVQQAIEDLSVQLTIHGLALYESKLYQDRFKQLISQLKAGCRNQDLPKTSRLQLLQIIELHGLQWKNTSQVENYYRQIFGRQDSQIKSAAVNEKVPMLSHNNSMEEEHKNSPTRQQVKNHEIEVLLENGSKIKVSGDCLHDLNMAASILKSYWPRNHNQNYVNDGGDTYNNRVKKKFVSYKREEIIKMADNGKYPTKHWDEILVEYPELGRSGDLFFDPTTYLNETIRIPDRKEFILLNHNKFERSNSNKIAKKAFDDILPELEKIKGK